MISWINSPSIAPTAPSASMRAETALELAFSTLRLTVVAAKNATITKVSSTASDRAITSKTIPRWQVTHGEMAGECLAR